MSVAGAYDRLVVAVRSFGAYRKRWLVLHGFGRFVILGPALLLLWFLADWLLGLPAWPLFLSFAVIVGVIVWSALWQLLRPWFSRIDTDAEALRIEALSGDLDNQLIGALQLGRESAAQAGHSPQLVEALVQRAEGTASAVIPAQLIDLRHARRALAGAVVVGIVWTVLAVVGSGMLTQRMERLADAYGGVLDTLFPVTLHVDPGHVSVLRGSPVTLSVQAEGAHRHEVELLRVVGTEEAVEDRVLELVDQRASVTIPEADEDFTYRFRYGRRESEAFRVRVGDRAELAAITYDVAYPAYTGVPSRTIVGRVSRIRGLSATTVQVSLAATAQLHPELSYVQWAEGGRQPLMVTGRFANFSFVVERAERLTIHLCGALGAGFEIAEPIELEVGVDRDQPPVMEALMKDKNVTMLAPEATAFALAWRAEDDFGVAEVALDYRIDTIDPLLQREPRSGSVQRSIEPARDRVQDVFAGMFAELSPPLEPGDRITMTLTAKDNNTESGPGLGRSAPVEIVIVRPDLSAFAQQQFGFGADVALKGLRRIKRNTDLLIEPEKVVRAEALREIERQALSSSASQEGFPSGSEESVGDYFRLLAGE